VTPPNDEAVPKVVDGVNDDVGGGDPYGVAGGAGSPNPGGSWS